MKKIFSCLYWWNILPNPLFQLNFERLWWCGFSHLFRQEVKQLWPCITEIWFCWFAGYFYFPISSVSQLVWWIILKDQLTLQQIELTLGTPQGSRLSPLLFLILMSDLNLHTDKSSLTNYADDTQSCIISNTQEETIKIAQDETAIYHGRGRSL